MITVRLTPDLVEGFFTTGHEVPRTRVLAGVPHGARLASCYLRQREADTSSDPFELVLEFTDPERGPDRDLAVLFQALYHAPAAIHPLVQLDRELKELTI